MQCTRNHISVEEEQQDITQQYPHDLQLYTNPPLGQVRLENLQQICLDRLAVLKLVDQISYKHKGSWSLCKMILTQKLEQQNLHDFAKLINGSGCSSHTDVDIYLRRMDHISHFILRSAFAFTHDKRLWFFKQEVKLFKWRVSSLSIEGINAFIKINNINYTTISAAEKEAYAEELSSILPNVLDVNSANFYKMPFNKIPRLTAKRHVFLKDGTAFVPEGILGSSFVLLFKSSLCSSFEYSREIAVSLSDDVRLTKIFTAFPSSVVIRHRTEQKLPPITLEDLDEVAATSFPLCMRLLHDVLKENHHLKHGGRVQYLLFLKGIGLSLEDCLQFWRTEFTKRIDETEFQKRYRYSVRHLYGREGNRSNYRPFNCQKIMQSSIGPRDHHGCPFKHMSHEKLMQKLVQHGLTHSDAAEIAELSRDNNYSGACTRHFELTQHRCASGLILHPNVYYEESQRAYEMLDPMID